MAVIVDAYTIVPVTNPTTATHEPTRPSARAALAARKVHCCRSAPIANLKASKLCGRTRYLARRPRAHLCWIEDVLEFSVARTEAPTAAYARLRSLARVTLIRPRYGTLRVFSRAQSAGLRAETQYKWVTRWHGCSRRSRCERSFSMGRNFISTQLSAHAVERWNIETLQALALLMGVEREPGHGRSESRPAGPNAGTEDAARAGQARHSRGQGRLRRLMTTRSSNLSGSSRCFQPATKRNIAAYSRS